MATTTTDRLLSLKEVKAKCGLSRSSVYRQMREGAFPQPLKVGARAVRWRESEIGDWLEALPRASGDTKR